MKKNLVMTAPFLVLALTACDLDMPNVKGLNGMPKTTEAMADKMDETNEAVRMQKMGIALDQLEKPYNQARISPVPSGLMAWAKIFAESAKSSELVEFFYVSLREIEEVNPATGLDQDGAPLNYTDADKLKVRLEKTSSLSALMAIAGFAQDSKIREIIDRDILGQGRFQEAGLNLLALRAAFIRDVLLAQSLNIRTDSPKVLANSGMMQEALKYLKQLDFISRLPFHDRVQVKVEEKQYNLISFEEKQDLNGQKLTAAMWKLALEKSLAGTTAYKKEAWTISESGNDALYKTEMNKQAAASNEMLKYVNSWGKSLP